MRIYIGGVGPAVTAADIEKTFSSLGCVTRVELVRTNGRNFAYMDFEPTSEKTLAKLFSTVRPISPHLSFALLIARLNELFFEN